MRDTDTRFRLLEAGAALIHARGYHHTGLAEILAAADVPKGSFYHYFSSKEDFGLALVEHHAARMSEYARGFLERTELLPLERLEAFFRSLMGRMAEGHFCLGCPVGNLVQEMAGQSPRFQERLLAVSQAQERGLAGLLEKARDAGQLAPELDITRTSRAILAAWQGALLQAKLVRGPDPLEDFLDLALPRLLGLGPTPPPTPTQGDNACSS